MEFKYIISPDWFCYEKNGELFLVSNESNLGFKAKNVKKEFILLFKTASSKEEVFEKLKAKVEIDTAVLELLFAELLKNKVLLNV